MQNIVTEVIVGKDETDGNTNQNTMETYVNRFVKEHHITLEVEYT